MEQKKWPLEIEVSRNPATGLPVLTAGKHSTTKFWLFPKRSRKDLWKMVENTFVDSPDPYGKDIKARFKWYSDNVGCGFFRAWNGAMWKEWVGDDFPLMKKLCAGGRGKLQPIFVELFRKNAVLIHQAVADNNWHVVPYIMVSGKSPQELKEELGKGLWKRLCRNSFTRNLHIARSAFSRYDLRIKTNAIPTLQELPSTILARIGFGFLDNQRVVSATIPTFLPLVIKERRVCKTTATDIAQAGHIIIDTKRMAEELGIPWSDDASYPTILRRHEEYTKLKVAQRYSPEPWPTYGWPPSIAEGDYSATLLNNALDLITEGSAMRHCVGGYVHIAREGKCAIYSICFKGERLSTLAFGQDGRLQQHYGPCNRSVPEEHARSVHLQQLVGGLSVAYKKSTEYHLLVQQESEKDKYVPPHLRAAAEPIEAMGLW